MDIAQARQVALDALEAAGDRVGVGVLRRIMRPRPLTQIIVSEMRDAEVTRDAGMCFIGGSNIAMVMKYDLSNAHGELGSITMTWRPASLVVESVSPELFSEIWRQREVP